MKRLHYRCVSKWEMKRSNQERMDYRGTDGQGLAVRRWRVEEHGRSRLKGAG